MKFWELISELFPVYWTGIMKIEYLQSVVVINSFLYYENDKNVMSDREFDKVAKKLCKMQRRYSQDWIKQYTKFGYCMHDFDGNSGFDLWDRLTDKDKEKVKFIVKDVLSC